MNTSYLALGDSITTGYGVLPQQAFATLFYSKLRAANPSLKYINLGVNGLTSEKLVAMLEQPRVFTLLPLAKIISLTIGSNDLLQFGRGLISGMEVPADVTLGKFNHHLMLVGERIHSANPSAVVKIVTLYNPLAPMDKRVKDLAQGILKTANHSIRRVAREYRMGVVPVAKVFSGREQFLLGSDHLHPNVSGHQVMAELFAKW